MERPRLCLKPTVAGSDPEAETGCLRADTAPPSGEWAGHGWLSLESVAEPISAIQVLRARPEKGLSGQGSRDSKRVLKPNLEARDVDPDHSAAV
jgi:hypothetical protein